jgi:hypothetical protein
MTTKFPSYERVTTMFILTEAAGLGIKIGTDGTELLMIAPLRVPRKVRTWFEAALNQHKAAVIDIILAEATSS